jgi:hypothetical protein
MWPSSLGDEWTVAELAARAAVSRSSCSARGASGSTAVRCCPPASLPSARRNALTSALRRSAASMWMTCPAPGMSASLDPLIAEWSVSHTVVVLARPPRRTGSGSERRSAAARLRRRLRRKLASPPWWLPDGGRRRLIETHERSPEVRHSRRRCRRAREPTDPAAALNLAASIEAPARRPPRGASPPNPRTRMRGSMCGQPQDADGIARGRAPRLRRDLPHGFVRARVPR